jgi:hypothetical protein
VRRVVRRGYGDRELRRDLHAVFDGRRNGHV